MNKLTTIVFAIALAVCSTASANFNTEPTNSQKVLAKEIKGLLDRPKMEIGKEIKAKVTFTLNEDKEIVVLSIDSKSETVKQFIKSRLNYQKVKSQLNPIIQIYKMPIRVVSRK